MWRRSPPEPAADRCARSVSAAARSRRRSATRGGGARSRSCGGAHRRPLWYGMAAAAAQGLSYGTAGRERPVSGSEVAGQLRLRRSPQDQCQGASRAPSWCSQERLLCTCAGCGWREERAACPSCFLISRCLGHSHTTPRQLLPKDPSHRGGWGKWAVTVAPHDAESAFCGATAHFTHPQCPDPESGLPLTPEVGRYPVH